MNNFFKTAMWPSASRYVRGNCQCSVHERCMEQGNV
jgi:hypothetical protein